MARDDLYDSFLGAAHSAYMERPRLSRVIGGLFWGSNTTWYHASMRAIREVAEGGTVVDCPCGAGPATRELEPDKEIRYVGVDLLTEAGRVLRRDGRVGTQADVEAWVREASFERVEFGRSGPMLFFEARLGG